MMFYKHFHTRRPAALVILFLFLIQSIGGNPSAWAKPAEESASAFLKDLPAKLGTVEAHEPSINRSSGRPFVIHIQGIHAAPQAQEKIRDILKWIKDADPRFRGDDKMLVGLEGASGELHPEYLNFFPESPKINAAIVQDLFQKGELTGAELLAWEQYQRHFEEPRRGGEKSRDFSPPQGVRNDIMFFGVEDLSLYREGFAAYREILFAQERIQEELAKIEKDLEVKKSRIFTPALNEFFRERSRRKDGDYGSGASAVQLLPYLNYLKQQALETLQVDLNERVEELRLPQIIKVFRKQSDININDLSEEMERIEGALLSKWAVTPEQKKLVEDLKQFELLKKLLTLKLTRGEYDALSFRTPEGGEKSPSRDFSAFGLEMTQKGLQFYENAQKRDRAMLDNFLQKTQGKSIAVLVTGGFHTEGLSELMKEQGIGYAVIRPRIKALDDAELLKKVFRDENAVLPEKFRNLSLTKQEALLLKEIMNVSSLDAARVQQAIHHHSVLAPKMAAQTIEYALLLQAADTYRQIWSGPEGLQTTRSEMRAASPQENDFYATGLPELESYVENYLKNVKPDSLLVTSIREYRKSQQSLDPLPDYFQKIQVVNEADTVFNQYKKLRAASDYAKSDLIENMLDAYLFAAPEMSNRYQAALYLKQKIMNDQLENQNRAKAILDQYKKLLLLPGQQGPRLAFLIKDLLKMIQTLGRGENWVLGQIDLFHAASKDSGIPFSDRGNTISNRIAVVGLGGDSTLPTTALLGKNGYEVFALDSPQNIFEIKRHLEQEGFEPELQSAVQEAQLAKNIKFHDLYDENLEAAIRLSRVIYLDAPNSAELSPAAYEKELTALAQKAGKILAKLRNQKDNEFRVFVFRGTFPEGTMRHVYELFKKENPHDSNFEIAYQLDFARRGRAVRDEIEHQVVIGLASAPPGGLEFSELSQNRGWSYLKPLVESLIGYHRRVEESVRINSLEGAELAKIAILVNMAAKHNLGTEFAPIVAKNMGSLRDVGLITGTDHRIGPSFTRPTVALGGRLMQQIRFLYESYRLKLQKAGYTVIPEPANLAAINEDLRKVLKKPHLQDPRLKDPQYLITLFLTGIIADNENSLQWFQEQIVNESLVRTLKGKSLRDSRVALLGVAYKDGTDQITESAALRLFEWLVESKGVKKFAIYDPLALRNFQNWLTLKKRDNPLPYESVEVIYEADDPTKILDQSDMAIIGTPLSTLSTIPPAEIKKHLKDALLVDAMNLYPIPGARTQPHTIQDVEKAGLNYLAYGSPAFGPAFNAYNNNYRPKGEFISAKEKAGSGTFTPKKVAFFGGGYVGFVSGAVLANAGHEVTVIDVIRENVENKWKKGITTIKEEGLDELLAEGLRTGRLRFALNSSRLAYSVAEVEVTDETKAAIIENQFLYMAVNTPEGKDGQADLKYINTVTRQIGTVLAGLPLDARRENPKIIAIKSTVPGGVFAEVSRLLELEFGLVEGLDFWLVSNPEILVEGEAVKGAQKPSRTIFGIRSPRNTFVTREAEEKVKTALIDLWGPIRDKHPHPIIITDEMSSPSGKYRSNADLALFVSLANRFAGLAHHAGVDYRREIEPVLRKDPRFTKFMHCSPGPGYGGHCFPKDNREVIHSTRHAFGPLLRNVFLVDLTDLTNEITKRLVAYEAARALLGDGAEGTSPFKGRTVGIAGLTFKEDTDDVRESPSVIAAIELALKGAKIRLFDMNFSKSEDLKKRIKDNFMAEFVRIFVHDFKDYEAFRQQFGIGSRYEDFETEQEAFARVAGKILAFFFGGDKPRIVFDDQPDEMLDTAHEVVLIGTKKEYKNLDIKRLNRTIDGIRKPVLLDTRGVFTAKEIEDAGVFSPGVGRSDFGEAVILFIERSEVRSLQMSTPVFIVELIKRLPFTEPVLREKVSAMLPKQSKMPEFTAAEAKVLTSDIVSRFFRPSENTGTIQQRYVLAEKLEALPVLDRNLKLWIQHLAVRPRLVWDVSIESVSEEEVKAFFAELNRQIGAWGYALQPGQVVMHGSGFDSKEFSRTLQRKVSHAGLAEQADAFDDFPINQDTQFLATLGEEISEKTAGRLLAADALLHGYNGARYQIIRVDQLAGRSHLMALTASIRAYSALASAA